ncbi:hypothetical protein EBQ91_03090, partial [bacterium]|nr:hypothetical protein [bacterium]
SCDKLLQDLLGPGYSELDVNVTKDRKGIAGSINNLAGMLYHGHIHPKFIGQKASCFEKVALTKQQCYQFSLKDVTFSEIGVYICNKDESSDKRVLMGKPGQFDRGNIEIKYYDNKKGERLQFILNFHIIFDSSSRYVPEAIKFGLGQLFHRLPEMRKLALMDHKNFLSFKYMLAPSEETLSVYKALIKQEQHQLNTVNGDTSNNSNALSYSSISTDKNIHAFPQILHQPSVVFQQGLSGHRSSEFSAHSKNRPLC